MNPDNNNNNVIGDDKPQARGRSRSRSKSTKANADKLKQNINSKSRSRSRNRGYRGKSVDAKVKFLTGEARSLGPYKTYNQVAEALKISKYDCVQKAYENLFKSSGVNGDSPVPVNGTGKSLAASNCCGMVQTVQNWKVAAPSFKTLFIQHGNPNCPLLQTDPGLHGDVFIPNQPTPTPASIEMYGSQAWGLFQAGRGDNSGVLSVIHNQAIPGYDSLTPHKWIFTMDSVAPAGPNLTQLIFEANDGSAAFEVFSRINQAGVWTTTQSLQGKATVNLTVPQDGNNAILEIAVQSTFSNSPRLTLAVTQFQETYLGFVRFINPTIATPIDYPDWIYN